MFIAYILFTGITDTSISYTYCPIYPPEKIANIYCNLIKVVQFFKYLYEIYFFFRKKKLKKIKFVRILIVSLQISVL